MLEETRGGFRGDKESRSGAIKSSELLGEEESGLQALSKILNLEDLAVWRTSEAWKRRSSEVFQEQRGCILR